jgi:glycine/D-amino acid oxidase-like deaminating enzyme
MGQRQPGWRVAVVGGGLAGSLLALELVELGLRVTLVDAARDQATALSYGGVAWWAGGPGPLGRLIRQAPSRWRRLQARHGSLGWRGCGLRLHGAGWTTPLLRPPFAQVDSACLMAALPAVLEARGVTVRLARVVAPPRPLAAGWQLDLLPGGALTVDQVVLAAGAGCRSLAPQLPVRLRTSWAGVLSVRSLPAAATAPSPWLEQVRRGCIVQPRHWQRPALESRSMRLEREEWIVDAGLAPWGEGLLAGQTSLVRPESSAGEQPAAAVMEARLRQGLAALDPLLGGLQGSFAQVPVAFCADGLPLVGPLAGPAGRWVFTGFSGAFAQVPVLAPLLAEAMAGAGDLTVLAGLGTLPG